MASFVNLGKLPGDMRCMCRLLWHLARKFTIGNINVPESDHVLRYCSPLHMKGEKVRPGAFDFRSGEKFLSVNWMEYFGKGMSQYVQVAKIRATMSKNLTLKANGRFAKINVGSITGGIKNAQVRHIPEFTNPSHAGICVANEQNRELTLEFANLVKPNDVFPAVLPK